MDGLMARAKRHYIPNQIWHITQRCHKREFLLKFKLDRHRWTQWLFKAKKRFGLVVLNYIATSNHTNACPSIGYGTVNTRCLRPSRRLSPSQPPRRRLLSVRRIPFRRAPTGLGRSVCPPFWLLAALYLDVIYRWQWVFSIPKRLRIYFMYDRNMLSWHHSGFHVYVGPTIWPDDQMAIIPTNHEACVKKPMPALVEYWRKTGPPYLNQIA